MRVAPLVAVMLVACSSSTDPAPAQPEAGVEASAPPTCARAARVTTIPDACNGKAALCDRRFDQVAFPMTHNAMSNADDRWAAPNQDHGIARQLSDGVRGLMLDTHYFDEGSGLTLDERLPDVPAVDQVYLCHGVCALGRRRLLEGLCDVTAFLDANRGEVVSIIFESYVGPEDMVAVLGAAGLTDYVFTYQGTFPTLREMIAKDQRLFVFVEDGGGTPAWYHPAWSIVRDTPYSFSKASDFSCALNRGKASNPLFLLNHWIGDPLANPERAAEVNVKDVLLARAEECAKEQGSTPNFVGVDFYDIGDLFAVVDALNGF